MSDTGVFGGGGGVLMWVSRPAREREVGRVLCVLMAAFGGYVYVGVYIFNRDIYIYISDSFVKELVLRRRPRSVQYLAVFVREGGL